MTLKEGLRVLSESSFEACGVHWKHVILTLTSVCLHVWDFVSDVIITISFIHNGDVAWFGLSIAIISLSLIESAHSSFEFGSRSGMSFKKKLAFSVLGFLNIHPIWESFNVIFRLRGDVKNPLALKSIRFFNEAKFKESMVESLPQLLLQTYVLLRDLESKGTWSSIGAASIVSSLVSVSMGLFNKYPSRVDALSALNSILLFVFTMSGTCARILFFVGLALVIRGAMFGVAAAVAFWNLTSRLVAGRLFSCSRVQTMEEPSQGESKESFSWVLKAARACVNSVIEVLLLSPFTTAPTLSKVSWQQESVVMAGQIAAQIAIGLWFGLTMSGEEKVALGFALLGAALSQALLAIHQFWLVSAVQKTSLDFAHKIRTLSWTDSPLPGEVDVEFVEKEGEETFLMTAAQLGYAAMLHNLILRNANPLTRESKTQLTALGKSSDPKCSTLLIEYLFNNYPTPFLLQEQQMCSQIRRSPLPEHKGLLIFALQRCYPERTKLLKALESEPLLFIEDILSEEMNAMCGILPESSTATECVFDFVADAPMPSDQVSALADALAQNPPNLKSLTLKKNGITSEGARLLADALKLNSTLTHLKLERNSIGDKGAAHLADALRVNTSLVSVEITRDYLHDDGARRLAEALAVNTTLTNLVLSRNRIKSGGAHSFIEAVQHNTSLRNLDLTWNAIETNISSEFPTTNSALQVKLSDNLF